MVNVTSSHFSYPLGGFISFNIYVPSGSFLNTASVAAVIKLIEYADLVIFVAVFASTSAAAATPSSKLIALPLGYFPDNSNSAPSNDAVLYESLAFFLTETVLLVTSSSITTFPAAFEEDVTVVPVTFPPDTLNSISVETRYPSGAASSCKV